MESLGLDEPPVDREVARRDLPLEFRRESVSRPSCERIRLVVAHVTDGIGERCAGEQARAVERVFRPPSV